MLKKMLLGDYSEVGLNNRLSREKWLKKALGDIQKGQSILDAGAGELKYKSYCSHLNYTSQDFAQYDGKGDGVGIQMESWDNSKLDIISDIASIPKETNSYDNILCSEVFEHIPHPVKALEEFSRILKPGGRLVLTAPFCSLTHFAPYHFYTGFNSYFYKHYLELNDFEIVELSANGNYFEYLAQEIRFSYDLSFKDSGIKPNFLEKIAQRIVLSLYKKASIKSKSSNKMLNFGYHVIAIKK
jgi:ubiquinone/menaquinone biosynthesis C-methylase UbiE|tara:strand:+ start:1009 stop:1734 length:726 start_codon:yes stop_codon:yes gene_type:complete